ncbi:MAG: hypothetical protein ACTS3R_05265 [Inquilinaceae bacterium]
MVILLLVLVVVVLIGGAVTLAFWEIEPPTQPVEKPVAHERSNG